MFFVISDFKAYCIIRVFKALKTPVNISIFCNDYLLNSKRNHFPKCINRSLENYRSSWDDQFLQMEPWDELQCFLKMCSKIFEIFETYPAKHLLHVGDIDFNLSWQEVFSILFWMRVCEYYNTIWLARKQQRKHMDFGLPNTTTWTFQKPHSTQSFR